MKINDPRPPDLGLPFMSTREGFHATWSYGPSQRRHVIFDGLFSSKQWLVVMNSSRSPWHSCTMPLESSLDHTDHSHGAASPIAYERRLCTGFGLCAGGGL